MHTYQVDLGISVSSVTLSDDGGIVRPFTEKKTYTVSVSNVQNRAETPNTIVPLSSKTFMYRAADGFEDGGAEGWTPLNVNRWSAVMDEGDGAYYLNRSDFDSRWQR